MEDMEGEGLSENEKGIRSSVGYTRKILIKTTGQITIKNITAIMARVNSQFLFTLPVRH